MEGLQFTGNILDLKKREKDHKGTIIFFMVGTTIGTDVQKQENQVLSIHLLVSTINYITGYKDAL